MRPGGPQGSIPVAGRVATMKFVLGETGVALTGAVIGHLMARGFDGAVAQGATIVLRAGREVWAVTNHFRLRPGVRDQVLASFAAAVVHAVTNSPPSGSRL